MSLAQCGGGGSVVHIVGGENVSRPLMTRFMERLNPMVALLDPAVHDFTSMRRSSLLFTTIMAAAAKFFRKELYDALISHCQTLLLRSIFAGHCSVELVQSLILLVFWKTPVDKSAWVNIGIAVRLSHQLGLHMPRTEPLPADTEEATMIRDRERTWFCECRRGISADARSVMWVRPEGDADGQAWTERESCLGSLMTGIPTFSASLIRYLRTSL